MKLKTILFLIFFIACGAGEGDVEVTENTSSNSDEPTTTTEQQKENIYNIHKIHRNIGTEK